MLHLLIEGIAGGKNILCSRIAHHGAGASAADIGCVLKGILHAGSQPLVPVCKQLAYGIRVGGGHGFKNILVNDQLAVIPPVIGCLDADIIKGQPCPLHTAVKNHSHIAQKVGNIGVIVEKPLLGFFFPEFNLLVTHFLLLFIGERRIFLIVCSLFQPFIQFLHKRVVIFYKTL